jgi:hypothetical protein
LYNLAQFEQSKYSRIEQMASVNNSIDNLKQNKPKFFDKRVKVRVRNNQSNEEYEISKTLHKKNRLNQDLIIGKF